MKTPIWAPWPDSCVQIVGIGPSWISSPPPTTFPEGVKKTNRKHDLNQERIHGWPKYYKKNRKNKWQRQINCYPTALSTGQYWAYETGLERKEDGKPCVISVTMILLEKLFRRSSPSFKQVFFVKDQKTLTQVKIITKHVSNKPVMFATYKCFAVLFFLPSCCVSSLLTGGESAPDSDFPGG